MLLSIHKYIDTSYNICEVYNIDHISKMHYSLNGADVFIKNNTLFCLHVNIIQATKLVVAYLLFLIPRCIPRILLASELYIVYHRFTVFCM